ncbi:hypothetical protein BVC80_439g2 [Macleaya cordata]|uniref:Uncharacterized protein n=1 Tax=Macleaya cordata TaxID=56857 RepID=A0A200PT19_MACCD|nr:hypothetical protein BVC80_439g2 [Macleaya cordata]
MPPKLKQRRKEATEERYRKRNKKNKKERFTLVGSISSSPTALPSSPATIPQNLLKDCKALQNISLHHSPISMDQFQQVRVLSKPFCRVCFGGGNLIILKP